MSLIKPILKPYAVPKEFEDPKQIRIINFEVMTPEEMTEIDGRRPLYPPKEGDGGDGYTRRLTFFDVNSDMKRKLDINNPRFQDDLARYGIQKGDTGFLQRFKENPNNRGFRWKWITLKEDEDIIPERKYEDQ